MRLRSPVFAVLVGMAAGAPPPAWADRGVVVTPDDADGLYGSPSIELGALADGSPSTPGHAGLTESGDAGTNSGPSVPLGLSWHASGSGVPEWFTVTPDFRFPAFGQDAVAPSPGVLVGQAAQELRLPLPVPSHSPDVRLPDGRSATVVGEHTWFWTNRAEWHPVSRRVRADPVWVEVTATPARLTLDPGNGQTAVSCAGPGTPYDRSFGLHATSPDCDVVYERASVGETDEQVRGRWSITWTVSWRGFDGTASVDGTLPPMTSRADAAFAVVEAQSLTTD